MDEDEDLTLSLHQSLLRHDTKKAKSLIALKANVDLEFIYKFIFQDEWHTPLSFSAKCGFYDVVECLLDAKADLEKRSKSGCSPLLEATEEGFSNMVQLLFERNACLDETDSLGNTALHLAARRGHQDVVEFLVSSGAPILALNEEDLSAAEVAKKMFNIRAYAYINERSDLHGGLGLKSAAKLS